VKFLLSRRADPAAQDENFDTPLHFALWAKDPSAAIIDALLQAGADPKVTNSLDQSPIDIAEEKNLQDILAKLRAKA
jgi:ankyrin repeat protein